MNLAESFGLFQC